MGFWAHHFFSQIPPIEQYGGTMHADHQGNHEEGHTKQTRHTNVSAVSLIDPDGSCYPIPWRTIIKSEDGLQSPHKMQQQQCPKRGNSGLPTPWTVVAEKATWSTCISSLWPKHNTTGSSTRPWYKKVDSRSCQTRLHWTTVLHHWNPIGQVLRRNRRYLWWFRNKQ